MARRRFTKEQMIEAAREIAAERGAGRVTLEAVALAIGSTKGAVLHSFPTKNALLEAVLETMCRDWDSRFDVAYESKQSGGSKALAAYVDTWRATDHQAPTYLEAVTIARAEDPKLIEPVRRAYSKYEKLITAESTDKIESMIVWMACEGFVLLELMGLLEFDEAIKDEFFKRLKARLATPDKTV